MPRYEYAGGTSNKFWEITRDGSTVTTRYGRIGAAGQQTNKDLGSPEKAQTFYDRQIAAKLKKGYIAADKATAKKATAKKATAKKATAKKATAEETTTAAMARRFTALCRALPGTEDRANDSGRSYYVVTGYREFATWISHGEQPGIHLRHADKAILEDRRVTRCKLHRGKDSNWYHLAVEEPDWDDVPRLLEVSHKVALQRGGGRTLGSKRDLYPPLLKALAASDVSLHPEAPHAGGPAAKILGAEAQCAYDLACWSARTIAHLTPDDQRGEADRLSKMATGNKKPEYSAMWNAASYPKLDKKVESPPVRAARVAVGTRGAIDGGYSQKAVSFAATATEAVAQALTAAGEVETLRAYLAELDERIMNAEFAAVAVSKGKLERAPKIQRVLWRGADAKGYPALWLVRLADGYGLLAKLGRRWTWTTGGFDDVVATVPDEYFAAAAEMASTRDVD